MRQFNNSFAIAWHLVVEENWSTSANRRLMRLPAFFCALLLMFTASTVAAPPETTAIPPHEVLQQTSDQLLELLSGEREALRQDPQRLYGIVGPNLAPHMDFPLMSQLVLGKHWRTASPVQRERFMAEFRNLLVRFYVGALLDDPRKIEELLAVSETLIQFHPAEFAGDARKALVRAEVHLPNGRMVPVSFNVHRRSGPWQVYDLTVEGVSLVTNYRSSFSGEVRQGGLEALIERLARKNRELEARSIARNSESDKRR